MLSEDIIEKINLVAKKHNIEKVIVFGSFARSSQTKKSDLDLVFIKDTKERFLDRADPILLELDKWISLPLEIFVYTPEEFDLMIEHNNYFIRRLFKEGKVIYERRKTAA